MSRGLPLTKYQAAQLAAAFKVFIITIITIITVGNGIFLIFSDSVDVDPCAYELREGYPFFNNSEPYLKIIKQYPHDPGIKLSFHKIKKGESLWSIAQKYGISIDTIIAANPFIKNLNLEDESELVIPAENGVLFAYDDRLDIYSMKNKLGSYDEILGDFLPGPFSIFTLDDIRFVFFRGAKPVLVNPEVERLYAYRRTFQRPVEGYYTSFFGDRVDPFFHGMAFHNGIDIHAPYGTGILPLMKGIVIFTGWRNGYGRTIEIQHQNGYTSLYAHCSKIMVSKGEWVKKDTVIGEIGSTGRSTGPHLHFTVMHNGKIIDPLRLVW